MNRFSNSLLKFGALLAFIAVFAAACGDGEQSSAGRSDDMAPAEQQVLNLRLSGEPKGIDPHRASVAGEISIVKQLFSALFRYDENLNVIADLASDVPTDDNGGISKDGKTYTVKLRKDAKWSDGQALTAEDIVYSVKRMLDPTVASPYAGNFGVIVGAREFTGAMGTKAAPKTPSEAELTSLRDGVGVVARDASTVVFTLTQPSPSFLNQLSLWAAAPVRQDVIARHGNAWTEAGNLIGSGPFVLKEWVHNSHFTLEPNTNWHLGQAKLTRLSIKIIEDDVAAFAAYQAGDIDLTTVPPPSRREVATPGSALNSQLLRKSDLNTFGLMFNASQKPWDNTKVRQAFATAIDRNTYVEAILQGVGHPTTSWLPPGMPGYDATVGSQYEFDAAKARQLLSEAGYANGAGFPTVTLFMRSNDTNRVISQFLEDQFKKNLNVSIEIDLVDSAGFQSRFTKGEFNFTLNSWSADWPYADNWLPEHFSTGGGFNVYHYSNSKVDDLMKRAVAQVDAKAQLELYQQGHKALIDDAAVAPIYNRETFWVISPRLRDLQVTGLDGAIKGDWNLWKTWIAKG